MTVQTTYLQAMTSESPCRDNVNMSENNDCSRDNQFENVNSIDTNMFEGELFPEENKIDKRDINFDCFQMKKQGKLSVNY